MTDTSKEAVEQLAMVLRQRTPNNSGFDQERAANVICALRTELDEAKASIDALEATLKDISEEMK